VPKVFWRPVAAIFWGSGLGVQRKKFKVPKVR
jgi:hypothetical protein